MSQIDRFVIACLRESGTTGQCDAPDTWPTARRLKGLLTSA